MGYRCPEDHFRDVITFTCIHCSHICDDTFGTQPECDDRCSGYVMNRPTGIAPVTLASHTTTAGPSGTQHVALVVSAAACAIALSAGILICAVLVHQRRTAVRVRCYNGDGTGQTGPSTGLLQDVRSEKLDQKCTSIISEDTQLCFSTSKYKSAEKMSPVEAVPPVINENTAKTSHKISRVNDSSVIPVCDCSGIRTHDSGLTRFTDTDLAIDLQTSHKSALAYYALDPMSRTSDHAWHPTTNVLDTSQSVNHAESVISLYQNMESLTQRFPWILGCLISNDHFEVLVDLQKADCSINTAYNKIRSGLVTDREQYFVVTVQT